MDDRWRRPVSWALLVIGPLVSGLTAGGCEPVGDGVEVVNWWASNEERAAFGALAEHVEATHPDLIVSNSALENGEYRNNLLERLLVGKVPHTFQTITGRRLEGWRDRLESLEFYGAELDVEKMRDLGQRLPTGGNLSPQLFCVPIDLQRENSLFYNQDLISAHINEAPDTWEKFETAAKGLQNRNIVPLALAADKDSGFAIRILFQAVMLSVLGKGSYEAFFGKGDEGDTAKLRDALLRFLEVLDFTELKNQWNSKDRDWKAAATMLRTQQAGMLVHGDWVTSYFAGSTNIKETTYPGTGDWYLYSSDCLVLPKGLTTSQRASTLSLLRAVASNEAQVVFNSKKGSITARNDTESTSYTGFARKRADFLAATPYDPENPDPRFTKSFPLLMTDYMEKAIIQSFLTDLYSSYMESGRELEDRKAAANWALESLLSIKSGLE